MLILDTNAVIYLHNNQLAAPLAEDEYGISIITEIELLSFPGLSDEHEELLKRFFHGWWVKSVDMLSLARYIARSL